MFFFYQVCFYTGITLCIFCLIMSQFFDFIGLDGLGIHGLDLNIYIPISPILCILFSAVFGGIGALLMLLTINISPILIFLVAVTLSGGICTLVEHFIVQPLRRAENTSAVDEKELIGLEGKVQETIRENGFGQITYTINGNTYVAPAKSSNGEKILVGTSISICWIEEQVFYVTIIK